MNPVEVGSREPQPGQGLTELRARFLSIARRRVAPDAVEDVVQDALRVIVERTGGRALPELPYCFQVLRNIIGNHYQKERVRRRSREPMDEVHDASDPSPAPLEALESNEAVRLIRESLEQLAADDETCARHLLRLLDGTPPGVLARELGVDEAAFYRRVYRCRTKMRQLLERRGYFA